jgi:hypothetical protein
LIKKEAELKIIPDFKVKISQSEYQKKITSNIKRNYNGKKRRGLSPQARTIPTERPSPVDEVSANFSG